MKIRIGNDIKLVVKLLGNSSIGAINIQSVKAYIINTTMQEAMINDLKNKTRFISRFPIEPESDAYITTPYNINCSGYPSYRAFPQTCIVGPYSGFGVYPDWNKIYKPVPKYNFIEYPAPVEATSAKDVVNVFFPADAQLFTGDYKLVIVAKIY